MSNHKWVAMLSGTVVMTSLAFAQQARETSNDSIQTPIKEREQTLQKLVSITRTGFDQGAASPDSLVVAEREVLDARLDSAKTHEARIALRESHLRPVTQHEKQVAKLAENDFVSPKDLIAARVRRLRTQIELLREKQKQ